MDDAASLQRLLATLGRARGVEVIVVDGGSADESREVATRCHGRVLQASRGRASQMNAGAAQACGQWLWFLHADSVPLHSPQHYLAAIVAAPAWGFFPVRLSGARPVFRLIAQAMNWRSRLTGIATGDQGLFVKKSLFEEVGGYPGIPLMEDIALCRALARLHRPSVPSLQLQTSSRRWERDGVWPTVWLMWRLRFAYWRGVSPQQLWREYYGGG